MSEKLPPNRAIDEDARAHAEADWFAKLDASISTSLKQSSKSLGNTQGAVVAPPVVLLEGSHPALLAPEVLMRHVTKTHGTGRGPGGQNRNKVQTAVLLTHGATGITARASERRSIAENFPVAMRRLRLNLAVLVRCPVPAGEARTAMWMQRCSEQGKHAGLIRVSEHHEDFPAMLATSLDVLWAGGALGGAIESKLDHTLDHKFAATRLVCSATQLVKLWALHPPALVWVNGHRAAKGLRPLLV